MAQQHHSFGGVLVFKLPPELMAEVYKRVDDVCVILMLRCVCKTLKEDLRTNRDFCLPVLELKQSFVDRSIWDALISQQVFARIKLVVFSGRPDVDAMVGCDLTCGDVVERVNVGELNQLVDMEMVNAWLFSLLEQPFASMTRVLASLYLESDYIGNEGAKSLLESLKDNEVLITSLNLGANGICGIYEYGDSLYGDGDGEYADDEYIYGEYTVVAIHALSERLKVNEVLNTLDLGTNGIGDEGVKCLSEALKINGVLTTLDLGWNSINDVDVSRQLIDIIWTHPSLSVFSNIPFKQLKDVDSSLTELDLEGQVVGVPGAILLAKALKVNEVVTTLNLNWNKIRDEGAKSLSEALKGNRVLTFLNLSYNSIGVEGAKSISEALKVNGW